MSKKIIIMEKAIELFSKNGVESTSIQDITNACGISKGAFYLSFKSKDDLLVEITDYFIKKFIAKHNEILDELHSSKDKLTNFIFHNFKLLEENYPFISMCMRENFQPMNDEVIVKIKEFNNFHNKALLTIIQQTYGKKVENFKYDLLLVVRGLLMSYTEFITTRPQKYDLHLLAKSIAEKVNIIAEHSQTHFLNDQLWDTEIFSTYEELVSKEHIFHLLQQFENHYEDIPLIEETIHLLKIELKKEKPSLAMISGLVSNLKNYEDFSLVVFLLNQYVSNHQIVS